MQNNYFTQNDHLREKAIFIYIDALKRKNTENIPEEIRDHVEECHQCKKEISDLYSSLQGVAYSDQGPHPTLEREVDTGSTLSAFFRMAAVIVIVIGAGVLSYILFTDTEPVVITDEHVEEEIPVPEEETVPLEPSPIEQYASNFIPIPLYEGLLDPQFRTDGLSVLSPSIGQEVTGEVTFTWDIYFEEHITLQVINNRREIVFEKSTIENQITYAEPSEPGIYYWWLETEDEFLYVGKFVVPVYEE